MYRTIIIIYYYYYYYYIYNTVLLLLHYTRYRTLSRERGARERERTDTYNMMRRLTVRAYIFVRKAVSSSSQQTSVVFLFF